MVATNKQCVVPDENGVLWRVDEADVEGWVGNREYAVIREGAKKVKIKDPAFKLNNRDFSLPNPHDERIWEKVRVKDPETGEEHEELVGKVNPLWEEWESAKAASDRLSPIAAVLLCAIFFAILLLVLMAVGA